MSSVIPDLSGKRVALVANGGSRQAYFYQVLKAGAPEALFDEVWGINAMAMAIRCHRTFMMDSLKTIMDSDYEAHVGFQKWLPHVTNPIYTSELDDRVPAGTEFPLREAIDLINGPYFATTVAYALAFAKLANVETISLYGCDFTYPDAHVAERGRANLEYILALLCNPLNEKPLNVEICPSCTLLEAQTGGMLYGYDEVVARKRKEEEAADGVDNKQDDGS